MNNSFFDQNVYKIIDIREPHGLSNKFRVLDQQGNEIGSIIQNLSNSEKQTKLIFSQKILPFSFTVFDQEQNILAQIKRISSLFSSRLEITRKDGTLLGTINEKTGFFKYNVLILDSENIEVANLKGGGLNYEIIDKSQNIIGKILKEWKGLPDEAFTTKNNYQIKINDFIEDNNFKILVFSSVIFIDMVYKRQ